MDEKTTKSPGRKALRFTLEDREKAFALYITDDLSAVEAGNLMGVSPYLVRKLSREYEARKSAGVKL